MMVDVYRKFGRRGRAGVACCLLLLLAAGCSNRRSEQYRGEGDTLLKLDRISEARLAYQQSEGANPENPLAQLGLARCAEVDGDTDAALGFYERMRQLAPDLEGGHLEAVRLLVKNGRMDEAVGIAEAYAKNGSEKGGLLHAAVLLNARRPADAIRVLDALHRKYRASENVALNLGVAYAQNGQPENAEALLAPLAGSDSAVAPAAHMALIDVYQSQGKIDDLVAQFEALAATKRDNTDVQLGYARTLMLAGRTDEAERIARGILEKDPASGWANYVVGALKLGRQEFKEATTFLESAAAALPDETEVAKMLEAARSGTAPPQTVAGTKSDPATGTPSAALTWRDLWQQAALNRLLENRDAYLAADGIEAREVLVLAALFSRNVPVARSLASQLPADSKIAGFLKVLETRDSKQMTDYFTAWKTEEPAQVLLRDNALGYAMASVGARGQGLSVFLFCLDRWPDNMVALYNIAQVFRAVHQPIIAAQQLQRLSAKYPENIDAHQMLYGALREGRAFAPARSAAEASYLLFTEEKWSSLNLSQAYLDTGDAALALQVLNRANTLRPGDPELQFATAGVLVRLGDCAGAGKTLDAIVSSAPPILGGRAALHALCDVQSDDWAPIRALAAPLDPASCPDSLRLLAAVSCVKDGDPGAAKSQLRTPGSDQPVAGTVGRFLEVALGGDPAGLTADEQAWAAQLGGDPDLMAAYVAATALRMSGLYDAAWALYQAHLANHPPHPALAQLAFSVLEHCDTVKDVKAEGDNVASKLQDDYRVWLGLAQLLHGTGDDAGELEALQTATKVGPENPEVWFRHAAYMEKAGDFAASVESYRKLLALDPESAPANNNLAYMLLQVGGHDEEALQKAVFANGKIPLDPGVLHTLGLAQMRTGDLEGGKTSLMQATEIDPGNPTIMFDYGRVLLKLGDKDEARNRIRYAVAMSTRAGIAFPEEDEAKRLLDELK